MVRLGAQFQPEEEVVIQQSSVERPASGTTDRIGIRGIAFDSQNHLYAAIYTVDSNGFVAYNL